MNEQLSVVDRATLAAWRFVNVAGWTAFAFVAATALHGFLTIWAGSRSNLVHSTFDLNVRPGTEEGVDDMLAKFGLRVGLTLVIAFVIGSIVGRRVWRRQAAYAAVAAALYTLYITIGWEQSSTVSISEGLADGTTRDFVRQTNVYLWIVYDLIVASTIALAALIAKRVAARRPAIPDLSRLAQELPDDGVPQLGR